MFAETLLDGGTDLAELALPIRGGRRRCSSVRRPAPMCSIRATICVRLARRCGLAKSALPGRALIDPLGDFPHFGFEMNRIRVPLTTGRRILLLHLQGVERDRRLQRRLEPRDHVREQGLVAFGLLFTVPGIGVGGERLVSHVPDDEDDLVGLRTEPGRLDRRTDPLRTSSGASPPPSFSCRMTSSTKASICSLVRTSASGAVLKGRPERECSLSP